MSKRVLVAFLVLLAVPSLFAQRGEPKFFREAAGEKSYPPAPQIARQSGAAPLITLASAESVVPEALDALHAWNAAGREPMKNGFTRALPGGVAVQLSPKMYKSGGTTRSGGGIVTATASGTLVWSGSVRVENAVALRLHLTGVRVPDGSTFWVSGATGAPIAFDSSLVDANGSLYTPITDGEVVYLELETPAGAASDAAFNVSDVVQIVAMDKRATTLVDDVSCLIDATCVSTSTFDALTNYRLGIAQLQFVKDDGLSYVCSGGLLNDKAGDGIPYLLTANHCISTQSVASSLQAFFDYRTSSCNGARPSLSSLPRSSGATLLTTSANSDVTLLQLSSVPAGRNFLGWDANISTVTSGMTLYRISHPLPDLGKDSAGNNKSYIYPQVFSSRLVNKSAIICSGKEPPNFIYSTGGQGGTYGGSSGSPVAIAGGYVVGQLFGLCGSNPDLGCDNTQGTVDGALSVSWPLLQPFLNPGSGATPTPTVCTPNATTACVLNSRFQVKVRFRSQFDNNAADTDAQVKSVTGFATSGFETVFFYFNSSSNIEMMVKMLDQGNVNSAGQPTIALLYGTATPLRIEMSIADTQKGVTKTYTSEFGTQKGGTDFTAFVK